MKKEKKIKHKGLTLKCDIYKKKQYISKIPRYVYYRSTILTIWKEIKIKILGWNLNDSDRLTKPYMLVMKYVKMMYVDEDRKSNKLVILC